MSEGLTWYMMIVNSGFEEIELRRDGRVVFHGTVPAGEGRHLTIGDSVLYRQGTKMITKWSLVIHKGVPYLRFGRRFGGGKYVKL